MLYFKLLISMNSKLGATAEADCRRDEDFIKTNLNQECRRSSNWQFKNYNLFLRKTAFSKRETEYLMSAINEEFSSHYIRKRKIPSDPHKELKIQPLNWALDICNN